MKTRAFTLVELLAVIAILGILTALIIVVTGKVRMATVQTQSVSHLRALGQANLLYAAENRGAYVQITDGENGRIWKVNPRFTQYIPVGIPVATADGTIEVSNDVSISPYALADPRDGDVKSTIGINSGVFGYYTAVGLVTRVTDILFPSRTFAFAESSDYYVVPGWDNWDPDHELANKKQGGGMVAYRYGGTKTNAVTFDGSIIHFTLEESQVRPSALWYRDPARPVLPTRTSGS